MFEFNWQKRIKRLRRRHYDTLLAIRCSFDFSILSYYYLSFVYKFN